MNYLAHLYLCDGSPEAMLGSVLGDFRKGLILEQLDPAIVSAIEQHQAIDCFTDTHPIVRESKQYIAADRRRYAGILIDIFYDYYLSMYWNDYSSEPLRSFIDRFYTVLAANLYDLPEHLAVAAPYMIRQDWLSCYGSLDGIALTLQRVSQRLRRSNQLATGIEDLYLNGEAIERSFHQFFPLLVEQFKLKPNS